MFNVFRMMSRSQLHPLPVYFDRYIELCDDVPVTEAIQISIGETDRFPVDQWELLGDRVYAPGKWTVKDILQHLIDTERIFAYRALAFARGETALLPAFDENSYAARASVAHRRIRELVAELRTVHESFLHLFASFTAEDLARSGLCFKGDCSVAAIGYCMPGHQRWHIGVLEERYHPLLKPADDLL